MLRSIVVFCEGSVTEPTYVKALKNLPSVREQAAVLIEVDPAHSVPLPLVKAAIDRLKDPEVDEVWCLFDLEEPPHPHIEEAIALANRGGVQLAVSNPCFELWLILHRQDQTGFLSTAQAVATAERLAGFPGKRIDTSTLLPARYDAAARAQRLDELHKKNGTKWPGNPSTGMHHFLSAVEKRDIQPE